MSSTQSTPTPTPRPSFNIHLLGDSGVGKTAWLERLEYALFWKEYFQTEEKELTAIDVTTDDGPIRFNVWDFPGQNTHEVNDSSGEVDAFLIMWDATSLITRKNASLLIEKARQYNKDVPILTIVNKVDCKTGLYIKKFKDIPMVELSVKTCYNYDLAFRILTTILRPYLKYISQGLADIFGTYRSCLKMMADDINERFVDAKKQVTSLKNPTTNNLVTFTFSSSCEGECSSFGCDMCAGWQTDGLPEIYHQTYYRDEINAGNAREYYDLPVRPQFEVEELIETLVNDGYLLVDS